MTSTKQLSLYRVSHDNRYCFQMLFENIQFRSLDRRKGDNRRWVIKNYLLIRWLERGLVKGWYSSLPIVFFFNGMTKIIAKIWFPTKMNCFSWKWGWNHAFDINFIFLSDKELNSTQTTKIKLMSIAWLRA